MNNFIASTVLTLVHILYVPVASIIHTYLAVSFANPCFINVKQRRCYPKRIQSKNVKNRKEKYLFLHINTINSFT